ncbi:tRNA (guanosine(37)-N1)-methyltransferase TrmD [Helicobacter sp. 23-1048]
MLQYSFFTLFPHLIAPYFEDSILKRAIDNGLISVECIDFRDFAQNMYKKVDNPPISGGAGQVIGFEALAYALQGYLDTHIIFLSPCGKPFTQQDSVRLAKKNHISFVCGRYEGFDERLVESFGDEVFSVGNFILTGGELGALCLADSIARQVSGVLGNEESLRGESFESNMLQSLSFAKNSSKMQQNLQKFTNFYVPLEFLKGNHSKITDLKNRLAMCKTKYFRPDLWRKRTKQGN